MDKYWDQLLRTVIESPSLKARPSSVKSKLKLWSSDVSEDLIIADDEKREKDVLDKPRRTRHKNKKVDDQINGTMKNLSLTSDEGIDVSYNPLIASHTSIPKVILRPQHHLESSWTFWYSLGDKSLSWEKNQIKICTVSTIEQFWFVTSQLKPPSNISTGHTYSVFRYGILPDWEHESNVNGGRWMASCPKVEREDKIDKMWFEILFMLVGEHLDEFSGLVNGAEACMRKKGDRLEVWLKDVGLMRGVVEVGRKMKKKLGFDSSRKIKFSLHKEDKDGVWGPRIGL